MDPAFIDKLASQWWYYTSELAPGRVARGQYSDRQPMLPRLLMRGARLAGAECLDVGTMEGLIPVLMKRGGAARVLALDAVPHCAEKMDGLKKIYGVDFEFGKTGLMYDLARRIPDQGFDFINVSGLLYHVISPMHVIAGLRPLLKRNGLMIVATNVIRREDCSMVFNDRGVLQRETNTFWYHTIPALEAMIRFFGMKPIDCLYHPGSASSQVSRLEGAEVGYMGVVCRALDEPEATAEDPWLAGVHRASWEYLGLCDVARMAAQPRSEIEYARIAGRPLGEGLDLLAASRETDHIAPDAETPRDGHILSLNDVD